MKSKKKLKKEREALESELYKVRKEYETIEATILALRIFINDLLTGKAIECDMLTEEELDSLIHEREVDLINNQDNKSKLTLRILELERKLKEL